MPRQRSANKNKQHCSMEKRNEQESQNYWLDLQTTIQSKLIQKARKSPANIEVEAQQTTIVGEI